MTEEQTVQVCDATMMKKEQMLITKIIAANFNGK
jgi:hypothetical protein